MIPKQSIFKTMETLLFMPLSLFWQLLNQFLFSPWGLVVPITLLIALMALQQLQKTSIQLALFYADQFEMCSDEELPRLIEVLIRMEEPGVSGLVMGLTSQRETIFTACLNVLQSEFNRWTELPEREHHYRIFSEALLDSCSQFSYTAQVEAMKFVDQMMQIRSAAADSPESTADRQKVIAHCEQLLSQLESVRQRRDNPTHANFAPSNKTVASLNQRTSQPRLYASNGKPFLPTSARGEEMNETHIAQNASVNAFSSARADRLMAYQKTQQNSPPNNIRLPEDQTTPLLASFAAPSPSSFAADAESKFARQFAIENSSTEQSEYSAVSSMPQPNISEEYRNRKMSESSRDSENLLSPELQNIPLNHVPHLPTSQLMQLLHHPDVSYTESAQKTLSDRDGFQDAHMKLAWRLYHPVPAVRQEIIDILPNTPQVKTSVWLVVLLNDPSNDVRYRAASFLATSSEPALRRLLIDRGKQDSDARIIQLADRLNESQQRSVR